VVGFGVEFGDARENPGAEVVEVVAQIAESFGKDVHIGLDTRQQHGPLGEGAVQQSDTVEQVAVFGFHLARQALSQETHVGSNQCPPSSMMSVRCTVTSLPHNVVNFPPSFGARPSSA
jgi:hypothetical protein